MQLIKILGLVITYAGYSMTTTAGNLNSKFNFETQHSNRSYRAITTARRFVNGSSHSSPSGTFGESMKSHKRYDFDYKAADEEGNMHYHEEEADLKGAVRGTYGYIDIRGLYRVVDYFADANGFRAKIRTNEPGVSDKSPAYVEMVAEQPPAAFRGNPPDPIRIQQPKRIRGPSQSKQEKGIYMKVETPPIKYVPRTMFAAAQKAYVPASAADEEPDE